MIALTDVLQAMMSRDAKGNPLPFNLVYSTHDDKANDYGRIIKAENVHVKGRTPSNRKNRSVNLHFPGGEIRACHLPLITHFNGLRVS